ncbi:polysaccharide biosynthesis tyrosine autokinase [Bacteroidales bacterium OttesenSCG-928-I21]|nr:polysaccharide biosynthesis tyrosine autokinase [Bacteroidales bacterium OttesenSCG-928-I21]
MSNIKIPFLNQKLVLSTFLAVMRKSFWIIICIILVSLTTGFLFHRYTRPEYKTSTVVQIKTENRANQILNLNSNVMETEIAPVVELIKSNEFIRRVVDTLNFGVSYYNKGAISFTETFRNTPFSVDYQITNPLILDQKINCEFVDAKRCLLTYNIFNSRHEYLIETNKWNSVFGMDIFVEITTESEITYDNQYFFTINDPKTVLAFILKNLNVQMLRESAGTILITYTDYNAAKSAEVTNTIAEQFLEFDSEKKKESTTNMLLYIDSQMDNILAVLNEVERDLQKFRRENNITITDEISFSNKNNIIASQMSDLENRSLNIDFEIMVLDEIADMLDANNHINSYEIMAMLSGKQSAALLSGIFNSIQTLTDQKELLLFDVTENNKKIKKIDDQIVSKKNTIKDFIASAKIRLREDKNSIDKKIQELKLQIYEVNSYDEIEYARLNRLYSLNQNFYSQLMKTKAEAMVSQAGYITNNLILEKASTPAKPSYPELNKVLLIAFLISIFISFIYVLVRYLFYYKILTINDIKEYTDLPVLGAIPNVKIDMDTSKVIVHLRSRSIVSEAFRNLRTKIEFYPLQNPDDARVIAVSSTIAGEGKTFVALNTAAIFAMCDKKTVILDLDLRKPRLHKSFNTENIKGVSTILLGRHAYSECLCDSEIETLKYITSGPVPPNPAEIILSDSYKQLIDDLKKEFDIIVIDTPPAGIVIDAITSYKLADNILYVMRSEVSNRNFINNIISIATDNNLNNTSIVLNAISSASSKFGYGGGYRYGYGNYTYGMYGEENKKNVRNTYYGEEFEGSENIFKRIFKRKNK